MTTPTSPDTAARSLAHWSEAGRREMEAFYALARRDYEVLAGALDWALCSAPCVTNVPWTAAS